MWTGLIDCHKVPIIIWHVALPKNLYIYLPFLSPSGIISH